MHVLNSQEFRFGNIKHDDVVVLGCPEGLAELQEIAEKN